MYYNDYDWNINDSFLLEDNDTEIKEIQLNACEALEKYIKNELDKFLTPSNSNFTKYSVDRNKNGSFQRFHNFYVVKIFLHGDYQKNCNREKIKLVIFNKEKEIFDAIEEGIKDYTIDRGKSYILKNTESKDTEKSGVNITVQLKDCPILEKFSLLVTLKGLTKQGSGGKENEKNLINAIKEIAIKYNGFNLVFKSKEGKTIKIENVTDCTDSSQNTKSKEGGVNKADLTLITNNGKRNVPISLKQTNASCWQQGTVVSKLCRSFFDLVYKSNIISAIKLSTSIDFYYKSLQDLSKRKATNDKNLKEIENQKEKCRNEINSILNIYLNYNSALYALNTTFGNSNNTNTIPYKNGMVEPKIPNVKIPDIQLPILSMPISKKTPIKYYKTFVTEIKKQIGNITDKKDIDLEKKYPYNTYKNYFDQKIEELSKTHKIENDELIINDTKYTLPDSNNTKKDSETEFEYFQNMYTKIAKFGQKSDVDDSAKNGIAFPIVDDYIGIIKDGEADGRQALLKEFIFGDDIETSEDGQKGFVMVYDFDEKDFHQKTNSMNNNTNTLTIECEHLFSNLKDVQDIPDYDPWIVMRNYGDRYVDGFNIQGIGIIINYKSKLSGNFYETTLTKLYILGKLFQQESKDIFPLEVTNDKRYKLNVDKINEKFSEYINSLKDDNEIKKIYNNIQSKTKVLSVFTKNDCVDVNKFLSAFNNVLHNLSASKNESIIDNLLDIYEILNECNIDNKFRKRFKQAIINIL